MNKSKAMTIINTIILSVVLVLAIIMVCWCFYTEHHYIASATVTDSTIEREVYCVDETGNYWAFYTDRAYELKRSDVITLKMYDNETRDFRSDDEIVDYKVDR